MEQQFFDPGVLDLGGGSLESTTCRRKQAEDETNDGYG
jgi:hypothetical protein